MILITGGMGFIGMHTANCFLEAGEDVLLMQHSARREPEFLRRQNGRRVAIEQADIIDADAVLDLVRRYEVSGIVHLVAPPVRGLAPEEEYRINTFGLLNVLEAARECGVRRVTFGSSGSVYLGIPQGPYSEDLPLPVPSRNATEAYKKALEILALHYADRTGLEVVTARLGHIFGPLYYSMVNLPSRLCHAAVKGVEPDFSGPAGVPFAGDEGDFCYVKDCARGLQLLQMAPRVQHRIYNIGGGRAITNGDIVNAVKKAAPGVQIKLREGRSPQARTNPVMDLSRIKEDAGYQPQYDIERAIADYITWLRSNPQ
jgi:UDP-glucose 4-epimerase